MQKQKLVIESFLLLCTFAFIGVAPLFIFGKTEDKISAINGYQLVWSDEFDGSSLDTSKWGYQTGTWSGSSVQNCYTQNNVVVAGGSLLITARYEPAYACFSQTRDFTSGFIQTRNIASWTYGYFEARIKMPADANSVWPAFWMSPQTATYGSWPQSGEIDIMEARGHELTQVYANAHWGESASNKQQRSASAAVASTADWHTYAVEWNEGELKYYLDGVHFHTITNFNEPNATVHPGPFNIPFYLRLNMAVGGTYLDAPHNDANNNALQFPAIMEVDYVRVYEKSASTPTVPSTSSPPTASTTPLASTAQDSTAPTAQNTATTTNNTPIDDRSTEANSVSAQEQQLTPEPSTTAESVADNLAVASAEPDKQFSETSNSMVVLFGGIAIGIIAFSAVGIVLLINPRLILRLVHK